MATTDALSAPALRTLSRRHLGDFLRLLVPEYEDAPHAQRICAELERLERREIRRLILTTPPQHGKSLHASQGLPAWWLGRRPTDSVILASYSGELAQRNSRRARGFLQDPRYPFGARVSPESSAVGRWHTLDGGGVIAVGTGGSLTGWRGDLLVADDLFAGRAEADSQAVRDSVWAWWRETALTRLRPDSAILAVMTRWHQDDLVGRMLDSDGAEEWTVVNLPALAEDDDPLGREPGEALWPGLYGVEWLEAQRRDLGERAWTALYMGSPTPDKGAVFQREWMQGTYQTLPEHVRVVQAVDSSFKTGTANDYSVIATWAADRAYYYLVNIWRDKVEFPELVKAIKAHADQYRPRAVLVEDTAAGQSALQVLKRETQHPFVAVKATASKVARAEVVSPLFEAGKVLLPEQSPAWLGQWIEEHAAFPAGKHDDMVDTTSYALDRLRGTLVSVDAPSEQAFGPSAPSVWGGWGPYKNLGATIGSGKPGVGGKWGRF